MSDHAEPVIHVVDDDCAMRTALMRLLTHAGFAVKVYPSAGDFLIGPADASPGCLLLDLELPGPDGLDLQQALQRQGNPMPVVFISAHRDIPRTVRAIKAGASDFLLKPINSQELFAAIENALAAATVAPATQWPESARGEIDLSSRERVVLRGIVEGRLNKQIAAELDLSERTIKSCRADLMRKLHARSLAELLRVAEPMVSERARA